MIIFKFKLIDENGNTISRHKSLEKALLAKRYCKSCMPTIKEI